MNCEVCRKEIVLVPSATERARRCGGRAADYTKLFTVHTECKLKRDRERVSDLIRRINEEKK